MFRVIAACAVALACVSPAAAQDKRVALVIGNAAYVHAAPIKTALNDASDIGAALGRMGFAVTALNDATRDSMDKTIDTFRNTAKTADVALVFYAGHAIQRDGVNWLIPVDGKLDTIASVTASAVTFSIACSGCWNPSVSSASCCWMRRATIRSPPRKASGRHHLRRNKRRRSRRTF